MRKKEEKKKDLKENIQKALEMPVELLKNYPRMTVIGDENVFIENYKSITEYEQNVIRLSNNITVYGTDLNVSEITADDILIVGKIKTIEFDN